MFHLDDTRCLMNTVHKVTQKRAVVIWAPNKGVSLVTMMFISSICYCRVYGNEHRGSLYTESENDLIHSSGVDLMAVNCIMAKLL